MFMEESEAHIKWTNLTDKMYIWRITVAETSSSVLIALLKTVGNHK